MDRKRSRHFHLPSALNEYFERYALLQTELDKTVRQIMAMIVSGNGSRENGKS